MKTTTMRRILAIGMSLIIVSATSLALAANPVSVEVESTNAAIQYAAMSATGIVKTTYRDSVLNVRSKPTTSSSRVGKLTYGTQVSIVSESGNFYQISEPVSGYVSKDYIITTSSTSSSSTPSNSATTMTNALYQINTNSSYITCGFDGYRSTSGRHEGIDFKRSLNANVYSLTDGVVTYVKYGSVGSKGLSTIAIYNGDKNITTVYLHSKPVSLYVGQHINRGQLIANESWRGVSSQKSAHTHVELRPGKNTHAAKSVGDKKLDNPNPTSYWQSLGYRVF